MKTMHDSIRKLVAEKIFKSVDGTLGLREIYDQLVDPPNPEMGDLAFGCFLLAKAQKKAPPMIAQELQKNILPDAEIQSVQAVGPYLNIRLNLNCFGDNVLQPIIDGTFFQRKLTESSPKTMIEYSQPNTHKELHVGHMRNACLGDSVVRLMRYASYPVISTTFPGDVGAHVAKCLWYLKYHYQGEIPATGKGEWLGKMYSTAHLKLEDELGSEFEAKNREQLTEILKQLEAHHGEFYDLWKETRQWSIDLMKQVYQWAGIEFDTWYWESDVDSSSVSYVKSLFEKGQLVQSEGAIGMNLESENLGFCLLLKSDGTGLYATKDVELARRKFQDFNIEKSIYVVDMRQELHFKQVFKTLEILGFEQAKNCFHLKYNFVELPDGAMSSRKGNIVPLMKLVSGMEAMVKEKYLTRYLQEWSADEINQTASQIAQGAIKYGMLKIDTNKKIVFDMDEWLKIDGESGPFIQYSYARVNSLCEKLGYQKTKVDWTLLSHQTEKNLCQHLLNFNTVVLNCAETYRPSVLCTYLYELAKKFNVFYHECSIGQAETAELKHARLSLSHAVGETLKQGLALLGIPAPRRM